MATKDWKQDKRVKGFWNNIKKNQTIFLYTYSGSAYNNMWDVQLLDHNKKIGLGNPKYLKSFNTGNKNINYLQALKFAKQYMRKH